jgi:hypothetical protein
VLSVVRLLNLPSIRAKKNCVDLRFLFGLYFLTAEGGCPHVKSADARAGVPAREKAVGQECPTHMAGAESDSRAIVSPQKNNFTFVFQSKFRSSTTVLRVLSLSRWTKTFPKNTGTI